MQSHSRTRWLCSLLCLSALAFGQPPQRICAAHLVSKVEPVYPPVAKKNGIHGTVRLDVTIGKDGHVLEVEPISGSPALVHAAKQAVLQWAYTPTLLNGDPIEVIVEVDVPFGRSKQEPPTRTRCG